MMKIGLVNVDGTLYPNVALMRISSYYKDKGHSVEWALPFERYDKVFRSKVFTFTPDIDIPYFCEEVECGGTGYSITKKLPEEIDRYRNLDYSLYPNCQISVQFYSRGCIRKCPFCLVSEKEGRIKSVDPFSWNPRAKMIDVLDNNFFANHNWAFAVEHLRETGLPVKLSGVDVRILTAEQCQALNSLKLSGLVHIAWDLCDFDLRPQIDLLTKYVKTWKIACYVLVGFNTTPEQDLFRLNYLKEKGIVPFVQPYRDYQNHRKVSQYEKDLARWANRKELFRSMDFADYEPRKGFKCGSYFR